MNQRLQQFILSENISQSQFADSIGVARASISHILSGRNKPGFDFIVSMSKRYPNLNLEWLINGVGEMYKTSPSSSDPVQKNDSPKASESPVKVPVSDPASTAGTTVKQPAANPSPVSPKAAPASPAKARTSSVFDPVSPSEPEVEMLPFEAFPGTGGANWSSPSSRRSKRPVNVQDEPSFTPQNDDLFSQFYEEPSPAQPLASPSAQASPSRPSPFRKAAHYESPRPQKTDAQSPSPLRSSFIDSRQSRSISRIIVLFNDGTFQELK